MNIKRIKGALVLALFAATVFASCKKDNDNTPLPDPVEEGIEGIWIGEYGYNPDDPAFFYAIKIKEDGKLQMIDEEDKVIGTGTWELEDNTFTAEYTYEGIPLQYYLGAKYDEDKDKLSGDWGVTESLESGTFYLDKE